MTTGDATQSRQGIVLGIAAYAIWGLLPAYLRLLAEVPAEQILAHRILWSALLLAGVSLALRRIRGIAAAARGRTLAMLCGSAVLIAINWLVYMMAVQRGHVLETSLGYFINPLVSVALGVVLLKEKLRRLQVAAIVLAALGVLSLLLSGGAGIWIPLVLAFSFAGYGLVRKLTPIDALGGLLIETLLLAPPALLFLWMMPAGAGSFGSETRLDLLLMSAGVVTSAPLLMFAAAARRLPLSTLGLLQYLAPSLQLAQAVLLFGEPLLPIHALTFGLIWSGLALYVADALARRRAGPVAVPE